MNSAEVLHFQNYSGSRVNPQIEDGHVKIANDLFDEILRHGFTHRQQTILLALIRKTYGFNKKEDDISKSQLAEMTGMHLPHIGTTLRELAAMNVITLSDGKYAQHIKINKHFDTWKEVTKTVTQVTKTVETGYRNSTHKRQLQKTDKNSIRPTVLDETLHDEHVTLYKAHLEAVKKEQAADAKRLQDKAWDAFWQAYPRKEGKKPARVLWNRLPIDRDLYQTIYAALKRQAKTPRWQDKEYIPHPKTWLFQERWNDEIDASSGSADDVMAAYAGRMIKK